MTNGAAFGMIERAVRELIHDRMPDSVGKTGAALSYERGRGFYVWIGLFDGNSNPLEGEWVVDIDVFADEYSVAMLRALDLEAALLRPNYGRTATMRLDRIACVKTPTSVPWDDEKVYRIGATYTFSARRSA